jgi:hypothetical protein
MRAACYLFPDTEVIMKRRIFVFAFFAAALAALSLAACGGILEAPAAADGGVSGGKGRVIVSIAGGLSPAEAAENAALINRTLLPELGALDYKLEFTRQGETESAVTKTVTTATLTQDLDEGNYTLTVTACKTGTNVAVAGGSAPLTVFAGQTVDVRVALALTPSQASIGFLNYAVTLPAGITLTGGLLDLYPLSGGAVSVNINLSGGLSDSEAIPSGYYRVQLSIYGSTIDGAGKFAAKTSILHINDSFTTTAAYTLGTGDFSDFSDIVYTAENQTELTAALNSIKAASGTAFTILVTGDFFSLPVSLADTGYNGKTITLRSAGGGVSSIREISLASPGPLFTVGAASSELVFILRDITLKGMTGNNAALLRIDNGELIMEDGSVVAGNTNTSSASFGGGVYVADGGSLTMRGGASISGNTACFGGGVYVAGGSGVLIKSGGVIYGSGETGTDSGGHPLKNTAQASGNAISFNRTINRNTTAGPDLNFTIDIDIGWWDADFTGTELYTAENQTELSAVLNSIKAASGTAFTILVIGDFSSPPVSLADAGYSGKTISLCSGISGAREISLAGQGSLFTVGETSSEPVLILQDITLKGMAENNAALLKVAGGALIMKDGSVITGNTNSTSPSYGGGVYVTEGTFTMRGGASVSGNTASSSVWYSAFAYGGGVYVAGGTFTMQDSASVSGNAASSSAEYSTYSYGGGVFVEGGGSFIMQDNASVSGNTAYSTTVTSYKTDIYSFSYGGGVVVLGATFIMQDNASVSGNTAHSYASGLMALDLGSCGGGVCAIIGGSFTMQDNARISGNTASVNTTGTGSRTYGGGVYAGGTSALIKSGGVIYGSNETGNDANGNPLKNTARTNGHAVSLNGKQNRNATAGLNLNFTTGVDSDWWD